MRITELKIENFRGIKSANIKFPETSRVLCLIGPGDSTKSTILKAIEWLLYPTQNLFVSESDFFLRDVSKPICIMGSITEVPSQLVVDDKYGLFLRDPAVELGLDSAESFNDEPKRECDVNDTALAVKLTVGDNLDATWEVVCNHRSEKKTISPADRRLFYVESIGANYSKDLFWGRYSALQKIKLKDKKDGDNDDKRDTNMQRIRSAVNKVDLNEIDEETREYLYQVGMDYGVPLSQSNLKNRIQLQSNSSFASAIGLFEGEVPLAQKGTGSQRLLSMGLNIEGSDSSGILLLDEIENGLEPYRLRTLINILRNRHMESGQVIMTTHSPVAVEELRVSELLIAQHHINTDKDDYGTTDVKRLYTGDRDVDGDVQRSIRANPEAYLSRNVIVCEGSTEIGIMRALDAHMTETFGKQRFANYGVFYADGMGSNIFTYADTFVKCGYDICIFMDSDKQEIKKKEKEKIEKYESEKARFRKEGVKVFDCEEDNAIEIQIFSDVGKEISEQIIDYVAKNKDEGSVESTLKFNKIEVKKTADKIILISYDKSNMETIGKVAMNHDNPWFKRIDQGEDVGNIIFDNWDKVDLQSRFAKNIIGLISWVEGHAAYGAVSEDESEDEENLDTD